MASLSGIRSNGYQTNWEYYVVQNQLLDTIEYDVENDTELYSESFLIVCSIKKQEKLKIISREVFVNANKKYARILYNSIVGYVLISHIRKPTKAGLLGTTIHEDAVIVEMDQFIKNLNMIDLQILNSDLSLFCFSHSVTSCIKIAKTPKADFKILGVPEIFISHKKSGGKTAFQQFSGVSEKSGSVISEHSEVQEFLKTLSETQTVPCMRQIVDSKLINYAVFGPDYGQRYGENNCHIVAQGKPVFDKISDSCYNLNWSEWFARNTDSNVFNGEVVLGATKRSGRTFTYNNIKYKNIRVNIYSIHMMLNRTGLITL